MAQLSTMDASFLYLETPETPMHVAGLSIHAMPEDCEDGFYDRYREFIRERVHLLAYMHRRVGASPLSPVDPVWIEDYDIDFDYHIRRQALPAPGTMAQLNDLVARLHAIPLDRDRPLWQFHVIEGLEGNRFALYLKTHHACMDGGAGMITLEILYDTTPEITHVAPPRRAAAHRREPDWMRAMTEGYQRMARQHVRMLESGPKMLKAMGDLGRQALDDLAHPRRAPLAPHTPFNVTLGRERSFGAASLPLGEVKAVGKAMGAKINDVVMTLCGGALRRYLQRIGELPDQALVAGVPASLRKPGDVNLNNQVTLMLCALGTDIADPAERLRAIVEGANDSKSRLNMVRDALDLEMSIYGAPIMLSGMARALRDLHLAEQLPPLMNVIVSNVPGPRVPLYVAGARMEHYFPVSIPSNQAGLNITVQSYLDNLDIGLVAGKEACADVQEIADLMVAEFETMKSAEFGAP